MSSINLQKAPKNKPHPHHLCQMLMRPESQANRPVNVSAPALGLGVGSTVYPVKVC